MSQFIESSVEGICANVYCTRGKNNGREVVAIRDTRIGAGYCSKACAAMARYKNRYRGSMAGPLNPTTIDDKMKNL